MGVRVRLEIRANDRSVLVPALVNSGYEASEPELSIPIQVAKELSLWPPQEFQLEEVETAGGPAHVYVALRPVKVRLILGRSDEPEVECAVVVSPGSSEVLISDQLIDALGITVISFGRGLWRHKDDPEGVIRGSEELALT